ncbi:MAG: PAS domain S-box protein [Bacteroidetes bacterium]|nr:PAS domain S-box protein [Bacteroidota bacterium]
MGEIRVLIVEDEQIVAKNIVIILEKLGYHNVDIASSGEEAIHLFEQTVRKDCPTIVLMDIMLKSELDGIETAKTLITIYNVALIFLTAYSNDSIINRAKQVGAMGYLLKPFQEDELRITMEMAVYKQRMENRERENMKLLSATLDSIGEGVIATDKKGRIVFMNSFAESITEWSSSLGIGKKFEEVFNFADTSKFNSDEQLELLRLNNRQNLPSTIWIKSKSGKRIPIEGSASFLKDNPLGEYHEIFAFRDITDRIEIQNALIKSERYKSSLLNAIPDMILYLDNKGTYIDYRAGHGIEPLAPPEEFIGKNIKDFLPKKVAMQTLEAIHQSISDRKTITFEFELQQANGLFYHEARVAYSTENSVVVIVRDITEKIKTLHELYIKDRAIEESLTGIMISDATQLNNPIIYVNTAAQTITGYSDEEILGRNCKFLQNDDKNQPGIKELYDAIVEGKHVKTILRNYKKDGTMFWNELAVSPVKDDKGNITHFIGMQNDVTNRIVAKQNLQESEERFRTIIYDLPIPIFIHKETIIYANNAGLKFIGAENESQLLGLSPIEFLLPESVDLVKNRISMMLQEGKILQPALIKIKNLNKEVKDVEISSVIIVLNNERVILTFTNDVTEKRLTEEALIESELKLRTIMQSLNEGIVLTDTEGNIEFVNNRISEIFGLNSDDLIGKNSSILVLNEGENNNEYLARLERRLKGISEQYLVKIKTPYNQEKWLEINAAPFRNVDGIIIGTVGTISEITERIAANLHIEKSSQKYKNLVENAPVGIVRWIIDEHKYEFANKEFEKQIGLTIDEFSKLSIEEASSIFHPDDRERQITEATKWIQSGAKDVLKTQYRNIGKKNEIIWTEVYCFAEHNLITGLPETITQISVDITDLKRAEAALAQAQREDFRRTVKNLQNLIIKMYRREDGEYVYSLREGKLAGDFTTELIQGETPSKLFGIEYQTKVLPHLHKVFAGESVSFESEIPGNKYYFFTLEPLFENGKVTEIVGSAVDITLQKEAEKKLKESENKFRFLANSLPLGVSQSSRFPGKEIHIDYVNAEFIKQSGFTQEEWQYEMLKENPNFIHPDDLKHVLEKFDSIKLEGEFTNFDIDYRFKRKNGQYIWLENHITKFVRPDGVVVTIQAAVDISKRKKSEQILHHLASFPEQNPQPIFELSQGGEITYCNAEAKKFFPDVKSQQLNSPIFAGLFEQMDELIKQPNNPLQREIYINNHVFDERVFFVPDTSTIRIFLYDITQRKQSEEELQKTLAKERELNAMKTQFITTISHEFRTPLTGIQISADLLAAYASKLDFGQRIGEIDKIKSRIQDLTELMNDFLLQSSIQSFKDKFIPEKINLDEMVNRIHSELHGILNTKSQNLVITLPKNLPEIQGDKRMIKQIIINLLTNASKYSATNKNIMLTLRSEGDDFVIIQVTDSGIGIPDEEMKHLFSPFFRGSNVGLVTGTGLGLSIVRDMLEFHGGTIEAKSKVGVGTVFTVRLPLNPPPSQDTE